MGFDVNATITAKLCHTIRIAITALMTTMIIIIVVIQPCPELSSAAYTVSSELKSALLHYS